MRAARDPAFSRQSGAMTPALIITSDHALLDDLLRLSAAAGVTPDVAADPVAALRSWAAAPLVLVGADLAEATGRARPPRRPGVHVVACGHAPDDLFRRALEIGAEGVVELPRSEAWLVEQLTDLDSPSAFRAVTIGVLGGSGGAGATTFACALGQLAARRAPALVVDADPLGPGLDRMLGMERIDGVRWDALERTTGRLSARSLREALPRRDNLSVLTWHPGPQGTLQAFAIREVLSAGRRGHAVVVVDLPRAAGPLPTEIAARCDALVVLTRSSLVAVASTARVCARFAECRPGLVIRGPGVDARDVGRVVGAPVITTMGEQRRLLEGIDLGLGPVRSARGPLARAARDVLALVAEQPIGAAA